MEGVHAYMDPIEIDGPLRQSGGGGVQSRVTIPAAVGQALAGHRNMVWNADQLTHSYAPSAQLQIRTWHMELLSAWHAGAAIHMRVLQSLAWFQKVW